MKPVIVVTGASRGLGRAIALQLAPHARLLLVARDATALESLAQECQAQFLALDVTDSSAATTIVESALNHYSRLDALVNNAGVVGPIAPLAESEISAWRHNLEVNLMAPAALIQAALPHLRRSRGRIVNISTGAAVKTMVGWSAYCTAKAGFLHLTRNLAVEEPEITSVSLRPGVIDTGMQAEIRKSGSGMEADAHQKFLDLHREKQLEPPEVPGRVAAWLALQAPTEWSGEFISYAEERVAQSALEFFQTAVGL